MISGRVFTCRSYLYGDRYTSRPLKRQSENVKESTDCETALSIADELSGYRHDPGSWLSPMMSKRIRRNIFT